MGRKLYRYTIFSLDGIGIISQIAVIFTRQGLCIENMSVSNTSYKNNIFKFSITVSTDNERYSIRCYNQIKKIIDIKEVILHDEEKVLKRELGVFKFKKADIKKHDTKSFLEKREMIKLHENEEFIVYEKTEKPKILKEIFHESEKYGLVDFFSSGAVVVAPK